MNPLSLAITKALAYTENGGKPSVKNEKKGKTGELKSLFQFEPSTWKQYAKEITGQDNVPLTPENEAAVTFGKVDQWVQKYQKEGKTPQQIATAIGSEWNSGNPNPNVAGAGVNKKYGVKYDTPGYAKKVADYTTQFLSATQPKEGIAMSQPKIPTTGLIQPQAPEPQIGEQTTAGILNA